MQSRIEPSAGVNAPGVLVQHRVPAFSERWTISERPVPEAAWHDRTLELLKALLECWIARTGRDAAVFRNIAVRVQEENPRVGFDPDLCIVEPAPPGAAELSSVRLWEPGHAVPKIVLEVVSPGHPHKDYFEIPDQCAALGVLELVVFDPLLVGPKALGGPQRLQVWRRTGTGDFLRVAEGDGPFLSEALEGYLVVTDEGRRLRVADDAAGLNLWPTTTEYEHAIAEHERAIAEGERAEKERALARIVELEAELQRRNR